MRTYVFDIAQHVTSDPDKRRDQDTGLKIENPCPKLGPSYEKRTAQA